MNLDFLKKLIGKVQGAKNTAVSGAKAAANFGLDLFPKEFKAAVKTPYNVTKLFEDYLKYKMPQTPTMRQEALQDYTTRSKEQEEAMKMFGFNKGATGIGEGGAFDPTKYAKGITSGAAGALSLNPFSGASLGATGVKGALAKMLSSAGVNAGIGVGQEIGSTSDPNKLAQTALMSAAIPTAFNKAAEGLGAVSKGFGGLMKKRAERAGQDVLGLTSLDVNKIEGKTGKKLNDLLREYGVFGKDSAGIDDAIQKFQNPFDDIVDNPNLKISKEDILDQFSNKVNRLKGAVPEESRRIGGDVEKFMENFFEKNPIEQGADVSGKYLTGLRREVDSLVKDFGSDAAVRSKNNEIRTVLQDVIRAAADKSGLKGAGGESLKELGNKLNDLYSVSEIAQKRMSKNRAPGNVIASMLGAVPGMVTANPVLAGIGATALPLAREALSSPAGINASAKVSGVLGAGGAGLGETIQSRPVQSLLNILGQNMSRSQPLQSPTPQPQPTQAPQVEQPQSPLNTQPPATQEEGAQQGRYMDEIDPNEEITLLDGTKIKGSELAGYVQQNPPQAPQTQGPEDLQQIMKILAVQDLATTGGKNLTEIKALSEILGIGEEEKKKPLTEKQRAYQSASEGAAQALDVLDKGLKSGKVTTGIGRDIIAQIGSKTGNITNEQVEYRSKVGAVRTVLKNALLGASMSPAEMQSLEPFIPEFNDAPEVAKQKLKTFIEMTQLFSSGDVAVPSVIYQDQQ